MAQPAEAEHTDQCSAEDSCRQTDYFRVFEVTEHESQPVGNPDMMRSQLLLISSMCS